MFYEILRATRVKAKQALSPNSIPDGGEIWTHGAAGEGTKEATVGNNLPPFSLPSVYLPFKVWIRVTPLAVLPLLHLQSWCVSLRQRRYNDSQPPRVIFQTSISSENCSYSSSESAMRHHLTGNTMANIFRLHRQHSTKINQQCCSSLYFFHFFHRFFFS